MKAAVALAPDNRAEDLDDPRCAQHWRDGTFAVDYDDLDGRGRRDIACDECLSDVMRGALLAGSFSPPLVSAINLDAYRPWQVAA